MVTLIGRVAILSIAVSTAAMMLILSVMNGMNRFVAERFWAVDPQLRIESVSGKFFPEKPIMEKLGSVEGLQAACGVLQDQALLMYGEQNCMIRLKGVDSCYRDVSSIGSQVSSGEYYLEHDDRNALVLMGNGVYAQMQIPPSGTEFCRLYAVDADLLGGPFALQGAVSSFGVYPSGLFVSIPEYDNQYVFCDLAFARKVFKRPDELSAIEVSVSPGFSVNKVKRDIAARAGSDYVVKDQIEQQQTMFKSMKVEKAIVVAVFAFVMLIATFTMVANQMLLMYEKRRDIVILSSMGMRMRFVKRIFLNYGFRVALFGTVSGILFGTLLALGQQKFGWVKLGGGNGNFITDAYPVYWEIGDLFVVLSVGIGIGLLASILPLRQVSAFLKGNRNE